MSALSRGRRPLLAGEPRRHSGGHHSLVSLLFLLLWLTNWLAGWLAARQVAGSWRRQGLLCASATAASAGLSARDGR